MLRRWLVRISSAIGKLEGRTTLVEKGRKWANESLAMSAYAGPAPVSLTDYSDRLLRQKVTNETISWPRISVCSWSCGDF